MEFSLYGQIQGDLAQGKTIIENCLHIKMVEHNSFHWGGQYYRYKSGKNSLRLIRNWDLVDEILAEEEFGEYEVLLHAESADGIWSREMLESRIAPWFILLKSE